MNTLRVLLLTFLAARLLASDVRVVSDLSGPPQVRYRCLIGKLGRQQFTSMATEFLRPEGVTLGMLAAYGTERQREIAGPRLLDFGSYTGSQWLLKEYDIDRNGCPEVQQAVKLGSSILLRWMDRNCNSGKQLLQGKTNPLEMVVAGKMVHLLELAFWNPTVGEEKQSVDLVSFFARTSETPSVSRAKAILAHVQVITRTEKLALTLRSDSWFYGAGDFPVFFPFEGRPKFPTLEEFNRAPQVHCSSFGGKDPIGCF
jgi:hypothetical protein